MKKIIAAIITGLIILSLCGCKRIEGETMDLMNAIYIYVDEETGVEYIVYNGYKKGGICPRYNADGSLRVEKKKE